MKTCSFYSQKFGVQTLAKEFKAKNEEICHLEFFNCSFGKKFAQIYDSIFSNLNNLVDLKLSGCLLSSEEIIYLSENLEKLSKLENLTLDGNNLDRASLLALSKAAEKSNLKILSIVRAENSQFLSKEYYSLIKDASLFGKLGKLIIDKGRKEEYMLYSPLQKNIIIRELYSLQKEIIDQASLSEAIEKLLDSDNELGLDNAYLLEQNFGKQENRNYRKDVNSDFEEEYINAPTNSQDYGLESKSEMEHDRPTGLGFYAPEDTLEMHNSWTNFVILSKVCNHEMEQNFPPASAFANIFQSKENTSEDKKRRTIDTDYEEEALDPKSKKQFLKEKNNNSSFSKGRN